MKIKDTRRNFLVSSSLVTAASLIGDYPSLADEGPLETTTVRLGNWPGYACLAPQLIAERMLQAEGFTDVQFVEVPDTAAVARKEVDFELETGPWLVAKIDEGMPLKILAGVHVGCYELFAHEPIETITDLKGKKVGIDYVGSGPHMYLSVMAARVGLNPNMDIEWVVGRPASSLIEPFAAKEIDAFLAFAPEPQELRDRKIGHVILNTALDAPWSHYFCCMLFSHSEFVRSYPIATKRCVRAILKTADFCAAEPELAAQQLVDAGYMDRYDYTVQTLNELPYDAWREYDPNDSLRFFALRLHEVGMVNSSPNKIIENGADWRFLNELKRELRI